MTTPGQEFVELFLQEASEHLRSAGVLRHPAWIPIPCPTMLSVLYIRAHAGRERRLLWYPLFSEVAGKLAHIFQYAMNATITTEAAGPLVNSSPRYAVLESDHVNISANAIERWKSRCFREVFRLPSSRP